MRSSRNARVTHLTDIKTSLAKRKQNAHMRAFHLHRSQGELRLCREMLRLGKTDFRCSGQNPHKQRDSDTARVGPGHVCKHVPFWAKGQAYGDLNRTGEASYGPRVWTRLMAVLQH